MVSLWLPTFYFSVEMPTYGLLVPGSPVSPLGSSRAHVGFLSTNLVFKELQDVCGLGQCPDGAGHSGL